MRTTIKLMIAFLPIMAMAVLLSNCKSSEEAEEVSEEVMTDTMATEPEDAYQTEADGPEDTIRTEAGESDPAVKPAPRIPLTLIIKNLASATAPVTVSLYGVKSKFPAPKGQLKEYKFTPNGNELIAKITDQKFGTYAVATYQDENSNGKIDKNFIGMPTEGFGFSNNYKPTIKAPAFKDCKFDYNAKTNTVTINMIQ